MRVQIEIFLRFNLHRSFPAQACLWSAITSTSSPIHFRVKLAGAMQIASARARSLARLPGDKAPLRSERKRTPEFVCFRCVYSHVYSSKRSVIDRLAVSRPSDGRARRAACGAVFSCESVPVFPHNLKIDASNDAQLIPNQSS